MVRCFASVLAGLFLVAIEFPAAAELVISSTSTGFPLVANSEAAPIFTDAADARVTGLAAAALASDIELVTGVRPGLRTDTPSGTNIVLIGTLGQSAAIDSLVSSGKLDVSAISGKWESFVIEQVDNPLPDVGKALVIAGSDRRGTAYGVFEISAAIGVSPWVWWADVSPAHKDALWVQSVRLVQGEPAVKYRGIFLNDEDWGLQPWAAHTFEPETGDIGPGTYAKICELLLRLRANYLWPAMHACTRAFNHYPGNKLVADDYAIVMGSSHAEPMLRNNVDEWDTSTMGDYNYVTNRTRILQYWDQRALENAAFENIYTIGMRGIHDSPMEGGGTTAEQVARLEQIFADQRQILANRVNPDSAKVPQVFIPYKEVLDLYKAGLEVPDDVTIMWPDDNFGYIRQLPTAQERTRSGGSGIYYHISYLGPPADYLWLCTTPPAVLWSEMSKAYDYGARRIWVLNVGDIKPGEIDMQLFLELARDPAKFRDFDQKAWLSQWASRTFGAEFADGIADLLDRYYRLNHPVHPEHLNIRSSGFSHVSNGDEASGRLQDFAKLAAETDALALSIPTSLKDAYFELVQYPIRCANLMNRKVLLAERSRVFAAQHRASTSSTGSLATASYNDIIAQTTAYNSTIAGGKWSQMMDLRPRSLEVFSMPQLGTYAVPSDGTLGVSVEGNSRTLAADDSAVLPPFNPYADRQKFIDVFGTGSKARMWTVTTDVPWITVTPAAGSTTSDRRIQVGIDWSKAPHAYSLSGGLTITDDSSERRNVNVVLFNPPDVEPDAVSGFVEQNGHVEIEAEKFSRTTDRGGIAWKMIPGLGSSGDAVSPYPTTFETLSTAALATTSPVLEYDFYAFGSGNVTVRTTCLPTYPIDPAHELRYAIAINDETPQIVVANAGTWSANVLTATAVSTSTHTISAPGRQVLKIWAVDPTVVIDKFSMDLPPSKASFTTDFEAENLTAVAKSSVTYRTFDEAAASAGKATVLESTSNGQFVTLSFPNIVAGTYDLTPLVKKNPSRGIVQMAVAENAAGPFTNVGSTVDFYASADTYIEIPTVRLTFATSGPKYLRFTVVGKNSAASNRWIALDSFTLSPVVISTPPLTIDQWRDDFFGTTVNSGIAADDFDFDGDGEPNLIEYATGNYPTFVDVPDRMGSGDGSHASFQFSRQKAASDVLLEVQVCDTLSGPWQTIWTSSGAGTSTTRQIENVEVFDPQPMSGSKSRFYRLRAQRIP